MSQAKDSRLWLTDSQDQGLWEVGAGSGLGWGVCGAPPLGQHPPFPGKIQQVVGPLHRGPLCGLEGPECVCGKMDAFITM